MGTSLWASAAIAATITHQHVLRVLKPLVAAERGREESTAVGGGAGRHMHVVSGGSEIEYWAVAYATLAQTVAYAPIWQVLHPPALAAPAQACRVTHTDAWLQRWARRTRAASKQAPFRAHLAACLALIHWRQRQRVHTCAGHADLPTCASVATLAAEHACVLVMTVECGAQ